MVHVGEEQDSTSYLRALGQRLKLLRTKRGMSRRSLATVSGISERYVAQFEGGSGNMSLLLLRRLAQSLDISVEDLIGTRRPERTPERVLLDRTLTKLTPVQLTEAQQLLSERFTPEILSARLDRIALVGFRGAGKSTLGWLLAEARGFAFVELDREVERLSQLELRDIFEVHGMTGFRRIERETLTLLLGLKRRMIIATGGGLVTEPGTLQLLLSNCFTVWLKTTIDEHIVRLTAENPDLDGFGAKAVGRRDLGPVLLAREPFYARADLVLDTTGRALEDSLRELIAMLDEARAHAVSP